MASIQPYIETYKAQPPATRQHIRQKTGYLANSPASHPAQKAFNSELLAAMQEAEKELSTVRSVENIRFELPDITGRTVLKVGKYVGVLGGFGVGLYAIGAAAVGIAASIAAFFAAYGIYLVGVGVGVALLRCVEWGGNSEAETAEMPLANQQNIVINVTASNGGNVTVNKEAI